MDKHKRSGFKVVSAKPDDRIFAKKKPNLKIAAHLKSSRS